MDTEKLTLLVSKLPVNLQPFAEHYIDMLQRFTLTEIDAMVNKAIEGNVHAAYLDLVSKMSNTELLAEMDKLNNMMDGLIDVAKAETTYFKNFISVLIALGLAAI